MYKYNHFNFIINLLYSSLKVSFVLLSFMTLTRGYLFFSYGDNTSYSSVDLLSAFWLGFRLDLSVVAHISIVPVLFAIFILVSKTSMLKTTAYKFLRAYYILIVLLIISFALIDLAYFSFFAEHSTIMIFGVFDDDTGALINTALASYNVYLIATVCLTLYLYAFWLIFKITKEKRVIFLNWNIKKQSVFFLTLVILVAFFARGTLGLFPIAKYIPDVSTDPFINKLPKTPTHALVYAYKVYKKSKTGKYDLIKTVGYKGRINEAFMVHLDTDIINKDDLLSNIKYISRSNNVIKNRPPHVVVVMVESFGMPLLDYQSETFNIMGKIKKHFDNDILFTNFISSSNGTISSLEALLLNIPSRPKATSFSQSNYLNTSFKQASARVYKDAGYETTFLYGGDLSWRNVGSFMSRQGFMHIKGKAEIVSALGLDSKDDAHDWGVYDEFSYKYVLDKLKNSEKPQFIFMLMTNNHPPYRVPKNYKSNKLELSQDLKKHIKGDIDLATRRFKDYAYAVDMAGQFLDELKASSLRNNTVVALTADNNTVEGIMRYEDHYTQTKRVPFYIYLPEYLKDISFNTALASSHKDIFPTLYNLTLDNVKYFAIGTNLQDTKRLRCGFNRAGVIVTNENGFKESKAVTPLQKMCEKNYQASLAVTEYMVQSSKKQIKGDF